jgi:acyl-CoA reductase-like NAD-dependent aldehyde dehydrogenase
VSLNESIHYVLMCMLAAQLEVAAALCCAVLCCTEVVEAMCGIAPMLMGETVENVASGIDCYTMRQPLGVCAGICPFNFPAMVPLW